MSVPETPYTRGEMYLSAIADGDSGGIPERPYTRKEMYLDAIARGDSSGIPERPYTREEMYLDAIAKSGGGGSTLIDKNVSANGTYNASSDSADGYKKVVVDVPNSYAAGDEGKVVSNGQLVAQTAHAEVTSNGTIDTTLNNSVVVNVSGGGSNWKLLASEEFTVNTTSTSETAVGEVQLPSLEYADPNTVLWVHLRDKAGKRDGYFYGNDTLFFHWQLQNNNMNLLSIRPVANFYVNSSGNYNMSTSTNGVYAYSLGYKASSQSVSIKSKYSSTYGTINGTFKVDVYKLTLASGMTMFD